MGLTPQFAKETWVPSPALVREQLRRLLGHPLFLHSKRYPVLLAYVVEQTLRGHASELKERAIGVEAFDREPEYDVSLDPVVRATAAEVRKRLIQYYYSAEHAGELVIELAAGSYVPVFREPVSREPASRAGETQAEQGMAPGGSVALEAQAAGVTVEIVGGEARTRVGTRAALVWVLVVSVACAAAMGYGVGRMQFLGQPTEMDRFWAPIRQATNRVTYCIGAPADAVDHQRFSERDVPVFGGLDVEDVVTLARAIVPLAQRRDAFRVVSAANEGFDQLREGPVVLIGGFDNPWTMRITQDLPFGFENEQAAWEIVDRRSVSRRAWTVQWKVLNTSLSTDYAIVARIHDRVTGQPVIVVAGILGEGTEAASEVVSSPEALHALLEQTPKDWEQRNLEAVIETQVIEGQPGPPKVVAVASW